MWSPPSRSAFGSPVIRQTYWQFLGRQPFGRGPRHRRAVRVLHRKLAGACRPVACREPGPQGRLAAVLHRLSHKKWIGTYEPQVRRSEEEFNMQVFPLIDKAMLAQESREPYYCRTPRVWPSEASAELFDKREAGIAGGCHRKSYFRMTGEPPSNQIDIVAARRFRTGRAMELDIINLAKDAGIFVAAGVRYHVADIDLPLELDLVVRD